jgi:AAA domain, putative AbiEii toxin, Type IV TA system
MRIEQMEYQDKETGWKLAATDFFPDLTLLVGMSGAGKTRILEALRTLKRIVRRSDSPPKAWGVSWCLRFVVTGVTYTWEGEYEGRPEDDEPGTGIEKAPWISDDDDEEDASTGPKLQSEQLLAGSEEVITRRGETIRFKGEPTPKLSPFKSAVAMLGEEEKIKPVVDAFSHMAYLDHTAPQAGHLIYRFDKLCKRHRSVKKIREADLTTYAKLAVLYEVDKTLFGRIVAQFREVFTLVEDVKFARVFISPFSDIPDLRIKERGVEKWIPEKYMSSGMFRTLMHLASLALWPDESVILIDEFENSLGVNCLDEVTAEMMGQRNRLQFIVTSHHPYIINNIPWKNWKVVTRKAGTVSTVNAAQAGIGKSRHDAFIQLINSPLYQDGVTAP